MNRKYAKSVIEIDKLALPEECVKLPRDYLKYAFLSADAKQLVDEKKAALDVTESEVKDFIRSNPKKFAAGAPKMSEKAIDSLVGKNKRYTEALAAYQEARHDAELYQAVVWALEAKKRSLTLLVELEGRAWRSDPKASPEAIASATRSKLERPFRRSS